MSPLSTKALFRRKHVPRLLERVQGHASLAPPTTEHPSITKYQAPDGTSLVGGGSTTIAPRPALTADIVGLSALQVQH